MYYCDNCGEPEEEVGELVPFTAVPFPVESANEGESAMVCEACIRRLGHVRAED